MTRTHRFFWALVTWALLGVPAALGQQQTLLAFELADQFDVTHSSQSAIGKTTLIIVSGRDGGAHSEKWGRAIQKLINERPGSDKVVVFAVAHVEGIPSFLRSFVRKLIKKDRTLPVLLDWKGQIKREYGIEPSSANILLFDSNGSLQLRFAAEEVTASELQAVQSAIQASL